MLKRPLLLMSPGLGQCRSFRTEMAHGSGPWATPMKTGKGHRSALARRELFGNGFAGLGRHLRCSRARPHQFDCVATMVKVIFNLSFTLTAPPPTFTGVMP